MLRLRWKILIGLALVFVVFAGIQVATIGDGPRKEVEAYKKSLIARGEKLDISELVPPPAPPEQNGAEIARAAFSMLTSDDYEESNLVPAMRMIAPGKAIVCFEQPDVRNAYYDEPYTNSWSNVMVVVNDDRPMTELLKQAVDYPAIEFYLDYKGDGMTQAANYRPMVWSANRLSTEAVCDLRRGDAASAATNICAILALVDGTENERHELFQAGRIHMTSVAANANWALLQSSNVNDAELAVLQKEWERPEFIRAMENTLSVRRAWLESELARMLASNNYFNKQMGWVNVQSVDWSAGLREGLGELADKAKLVCSKSMYRASWVYWDELQMLKDDQIVLEMLRTVATNGVFNPSYNEMEKQLEVSRAKEPDGWLVNWDDSGLHESLSFSSSDPTLISLAMGAEATRRLAIAAIALKRYQLKYGKYPLALSDLMPQFVSSVPRDPVDGKPLRYRLMANGTFLLYSIGDDGKDDGGDGTLKLTGHNLPDRWNSLKALDWVWPQPATPDEIEYFYAHPPGP